MKDTIEKIDTIISWWLNLQKGYQDINHLDEVHRVITGHYYYLCELASQEYRNYLYSYVRKKVGLSKQEQALMEAGMSATAAKSAAPMNEGLTMMEEAELEANYNALKLKINAVAKIIEAIKQRISNLKMELNK